MLEVNCSKSRMLKTDTTDWEFFHDLVVDLHTSSCGSSMSATNNGFASDSDVSLDSAGVRSVTGGKGGGSPGGRSGEGRVAPCAGSCRFMDSTAPSLSKSLKVVTLHLRT